MERVSFPETSSPLDGFRLFQSADVEEARAIVARKFCDHRLEPLSDHTCFDACHNHVAGDAISLNYLRYGAEVEINPGELDRFYLIQLPIRGKARVTNGRRTVEADHSCGSILNPNRETRMQWDRDCEKILVQLDRDRVTALAGHLCGHVLRDSPLFNPCIDLTDPALARWRGLLLQLIEQTATGPGLAATPLLEERLMLQFLQAQENSVSPMIAGHVRGALPHHVKRARDYIHANIAEPLTLAEIAAAAGCSIRTLQMGFRQFLSTTPWAYLEAQRLSLAHARLQSGPPGRAVQDIAYDCGFTHLGRFSAAYKKQFGRTPSRARQNALA